MSLKFTVSTLFSRTARFVVAKNNRTVLIWLVSCTIGVAILVSVSKFLVQSVQLAAFLVIPKKAPKPLPASTNQDESDRQAYPADHYQARNDIPHGPPGTVPSGLKLTASGTELKVENLFNSSLRIRTWYTQKTPSGELLTCHLVNQTTGASRAWDADVDLVPKAIIKFTDQYARLVSRGKCDQDLSSAKLEFAIVARDEVGQPYHFLSDTVFGPMAPPNALWIASYWLTTPLSYADKIEAIRDLEKRELQIRAINNPWAMNPLHGGNDQTERDAIRKIAHAPAGVTPSWLKISRQDKTVRVTNLNDVPIRLRLWFTLTKSDGRSSRCELGSFKNNNAQLLSPTLPTSSSATFDRIFSHSLLQAACEQAFDLAQLELAVFDPSSRESIKKYLFISDGAFSPSPPPDATSITFH
jgi:hypothetical protein